jgi:hypothetical protein
MLDTITQNCMWINEAVNVEVKPLEVPYVLNESQGHNYENLRDNPGLIDQLPELRQAPALYDFIKEINAPRSIFQTFGCAKWQQPFAHPSVPPEFSLQSGSYIEFSFADVNLCRSQEPLWKMIEQYRVYGPKCIAHSMVQVIFEIRAATNAEWGNWWTLEFWNYGIGRTEVEADQWWAEGIICFKAFLLEQSSEAKPL